MNSDSFDKVVSLAKRRGFIFQGSDIYGGLAGTWDYGPLGVALKENIKKLWWRRFVSGREDMYGLDSTILMNSKVWEVSGHTGAGFADPLVECPSCRKRYRGDQVGRKSPCCSEEFGPVKQFNLMFKTFVGPASHEEHHSEEAEWEKGDGGEAYLANVIPEHYITYEPEAISYLRPETAQGMFVNFKNIIDSFHPRLPFGIAQIGKAFRNEIAPRDFLFRTREFEIMELEYFVKESEWEEQFEYWRDQINSWFELLGFKKDDTEEIEIPDGDRAHYSKRTIDFHFRYPHKFDEIGGLAYRTDFDLSAHAKASGVDLSYADPDTGEKFIPHVIEPTFGLDRTVLALLCEAYDEEGEGDDVRAVLRLKPALAPVKVAVFPLLKNKPELVKKGREVFEMIKKEIPEVLWDDNGNIGKRYRRQDEIGTPFCVTIDFETLEKDSVTLRERDSMKQERVSVQELLSLFLERLNS